MSKTLFNVLLWGTTAASIVGIASGTSIFIINKLKDNDNNDNGTANDGGGNITQDYGKNYSTVVSKSITALIEAHPHYYSGLNPKLRGEALFDALNDIQTKYIGSIGSYGDLWRTYVSGFKDRYDEKDGTLYDIYSEKVGQREDFTFRMPGGQDHGRHRRPGDSYNREHLIPQSVFGKNTPHIHNDAHFVYPTDSQINGWRGHMVHDDVSSASQSGKQSGGNDWKIGRAVDYNGEAFEPDPHFKGDVARAYFYFQLTYHNYQQHPYSEWTSHDYTAFNNSAFPYFKTNFLRTYIKWAKNDPVDAFDTYANNEVAEAEGGIRNPFIDMPNLINLIWNNR